MKNYREAGGEIISLPGGGFTENGNAHPRSTGLVAGIAPEHGNPSIIVTPTLLGRKTTVPNAPQSCCCRLLALADHYAGRAGRRAMPGTRLIFTLD
ncbi:MAG TPA: hypothetical protein VGP65_03950 [Candidatus Angelobacter sp.]|nr:hypothetical protein [Candidatus Angelobacter sp.]